MASSHGKHVQVAEDGELPEAPCIWRVTMCPVWHPTITWRSEGGNIFWLSPQESGFLRKDRNNRGVEIDVAMHDCTF